MIKKDVNPVWNEDLTLSVSDPNLPIKLVISLYLLSVLSVLSYKHDRKSLFHCLASIATLYEFFLCVVAFKYTLIMRDF